MFTAAWVLRVLRLDVHFRWNIYNVNDRLFFFFFKSEMNAESYQMAACFLWERVCTLVCGY